MIKFGKGVVKHRVLILIIAVALMVPSVFGILKTRINYDMLTYLPDDMQADYDRYWTDARVDRVLDVLERYGIALEINARYRIPSFDIIRRAKQRGIKFTFGTNNVDADFGRLEYSLEAVEKCGLTAGDIWFPSMSVRRERPVVLYNKFE